MLLVFGVGQAQASVALVQHTSIDVASATSATLAFNSNNTAGNWIGVCIRAGRSSEVFTVTDSRGNTYHQAVQISMTVDTPNGDTLAIFYAQNIAAGANTIMVALKVGIIVIIVIAGLKYIDPSNWRPYVPPNSGVRGHFGWTGVLQGAAIIFFSYVGFDTASTTALEARNPQRDLPLGIIGALVISAVLYVAMATVLTGMVPFQKLDSDAPVAVALDAHPQLAWLSWIVKVGVIAGMTSVILTSLLGQPRILLSMADDGLLPPFMSRCHPRFKTPHVSTVVTGVFAALIAAVFPLDLLADLISMGILLAFAVVCAGVLVLRYTRPDAPRPFRVPWAPVTCVTGTVVCLGMTYYLSGATWLRLVYWTAIGMSIYAFYGFRHSRLRR